VSQPRDEFVSCLPRPIPPPGPHYPAYRLALLLIGAGGAVAYALACKSTTRGVLKPASDLSCNKHAKLTPSLGLAILS